MRAPADDSAEFARTAHERLENELANWKPALPVKPAPTVREPLHFDWLVQLICNGKRADEIAGEIKRAAHLKFAADGERPRTKPQSAASVYAAGTKLAKQLGLKMPAGRYSARFRKPRP